MRRICADGFVQIAVAMGWVRANRPLKFPRAYAILSARKDFAPVVGASILREAMTFTIRRIAKSDRIIR